MIPNKRERKEERERERKKERKRERKRGRLGEGERRRESGQEDSY